jgi:protein-tyrosine phosphatase
MMKSVRNKSSAFTTPQEEYSGRNPNIRMDPSQTSMRTNVPPQAQASAPNPYSTGGTKADFHEIIPHLFVGSHKATTSECLLNMFKISLIVNCAREIDNGNFKGVEYKKLDLIDVPEQDITTVLDPTADKIHEHLANGKSVLVHCAWGVSRSISVLLGYLMKYKRMSLEGAFEFVKKIRSTAGPNPGFIRQLAEFEKKLRVYDSSRIA